MEPPPSQRQQSRPPAGCVLQKSCTNPTMSTLPLGSHGTNASSYSTLVNTYKVSIDPSIWIQGCVAGTFLFWDLHSPYLVPLGSILISVSSTFILELLRLKKKIGCILKSFLAFKLCMQFTRKPYHIFLRTCILVYPEHLWVLNSLTC